MPFGMNHFLTGFLIVIIGSVHECSSSSPLYGYGTEHGDQIVTSPNPSFEVDLGHEVPFFGRKYSKAYISADGLLGFNIGAGYKKILYKDGDISSQDYPFIAAFHHYGSTSSDEGKIYYRHIKDQATLSDFTIYVNNATVERPEHFHPVVALQVTWKNVNEEGCNNTICSTATFQIVFVASSDSSFAFINYDNIPISQNKFHQAGFNGGNNLGWKSILPCDPPSCSLTLANLPNLGGSDVKGRFIFDVGGQQIRRGGCIPPELEADDILEFTPRFASLLGGQMLTLSGTCNPKRMPVKCMFGTGHHTVVREGIVLNSMLARCPVPKLTQRGDTKISFSVDGIKVSHISTITIVQLGRFPCTLTLGSGWTSRDAKELSFTWDPSRISKNKAVLVNVKLIGYKEHTRRVAWRKLKTIRHSVENSGSFSFSLKNLECQPGDCSFDVGLIEVMLQRRYWMQSNTHIAVNCGMIPLGRIMGRDKRPSPDKKCKMWQAKDKKDITWLEDLLPCPPTLDDAVSDFGRWQPDDTCLLNSTSKTNCNLQTPAVYCARSFKPTKQGAGNQCCYDSKYKLIKDRSTPDRSHDWGSTPYNEPLRVPSVSHWLMDIVPIFYCCKWSNNCHRYLEQRPAKFSSEYQPPKSSVVYGRHRLKTFDDFEYNFPAKGDFWLYKSDKVKLQGRFGTEHDVLTGVAMTGTGDVVEIRLAPSNLISGHRLLVLVNNVSKFFDHEPLRMQDFNDVSIITNEAEGNLYKHSTFTVIFKSEVGVIVAENNTSLYVKINLPPGNETLETDSGGLLGTGNDNKNDDLIIRGTNTSVKSTSPIDDIKKFGFSWLVEKAERLFGLASMGHTAHADITMLFLCLVLAVWMSSYSTQDERGMRRLGCRSERNAKRG
ncbi:protein mesh-like [Gigantopelta aegis]|uniref:protein mesh-like n=1 Tax=Gigantopelta aegis TaxID=1735272 RepID=UPI001B88B54D|nr:protein mesh-like [Gigantopelta aegis]